MVVIYPMESETVVSEKTLPYAMLVIQSPRGGVISVREPMPALPARPTIVSSLFLPLTHLASCFTAEAEAMFIGR